ncbi:MAG: ribbon-helix-helix domain-containing protein [Actinomycetota bacterium]|nr:ribbon-helix-helix domain-containing protein [Actinomycetota bacterium]
MSDKNEFRQSEIERRDAAQRNRGRVVEGSGEAVEGRRLDQMLSVRLNPDLVSDLRRVAEQSGATLSDLLREAAVQFLSNLKTVPVSIHIDKVETGVAASPELYQRAVTGSSLRRTLSPGEHHLVNATTAANVWSPFLEPERAKMEHS